MDVIFRLEDKSTLKVLSGWRLGARLFGWHSSGPEDGRSEGFPQLLQGLKFQRLFLSCTRDSIVGEAASSSKLLQDSPASYITYIGIKVISI